MVIEMVSARMMVRPITAGAVARAAERVMAGRC